MSAYADLIERLNDGCVYHYPDGRDGPWSPYNPDGEEAADLIAKLEAERDEAWQDVAIWKGEAVSRSEALVQANLDRCSMGVTISQLREVLKAADDAIAEMFRYFDGGETRGSYDGKPERNQLRKAGYATRAALLVTHTAGN
jgi:hypothetical protein